jgi:serine protease
MLLATLVAGPARTDAADAQSAERIIVRWRDGAGTPDAEAITALSGRSGASLSLQRHLGGRLHLLRAANLDADELPRVLAALRSDPRIAIAEPDRRVRALEYLPNDPLYARQWYLKDVQPAAIRANLAWEITRGGASVAAAPIVAVIDTGVRFEHPDLQRAVDGGKLLPGFDFISSDPDGSFATANDGNGWDADASDAGDFITAQDLAGRFANRKCGGGPSDDQPTRSSWHGTRVSGLLAAQSDNALGMTGAGFNLRILPIRALGKCGGYDSDVLAAMYWAAGLTVPAPLLAGTPAPNPNPARVINMSLGGDGVCSPLYSEAVRELAAAGALVVAAAGNDGKSVNTPASCQGALGVAGLRHVGTKVGYSNLGPEVGIAAPAGNCVNVLPGTPCLFALDTTSDTGQQQAAGPTYTDAFVSANVGTSFSSPLVAASAGLMLSVNPQLTPAKLIERLRATARPFPTSSDTNPQPGQCRLPAGSTDVQEEECLCTSAVCGAGMLDMLAAVRDALRPVALATSSGSSVAGSVIRLDGSASRTATGRSIAGYQWSFVTGTASPPAIDGAQTASATLTSPASGSYTLRLTVTDNSGATDSADVTVIAASSGGGSVSTAAPATPAGSGGGGGGGSTGILELLLLAGVALYSRVLKARTGTWIYCKPCCSASSKASPSTCRSARPATC